MTLTLPTRTDTVVLRLPQLVRRGAMHQRTRTPRPRLLPSSLRHPLTLALLFAVTACKTGVDIPDVVREPEIVGEVVEIGPAPEEDPRERRAELSLSDGQIVVLDLNSARNLGGPEPHESALLLYGTQPDGPWFWSWPLLNDPVTGGQCATIGGPALDEGESIVFEIGLRLPKAADFDPAEIRDGEFSDPTRHFCIDEFGEVTRYGV